MAGSVTVKARSRRSARAAGLKPKTGSRSALWRPAGSVRLPDGQAARRPEHPPGSRSGSRIGRPAPPARAGSARPAPRATRTRRSTTLTLAPGAGRPGTPRAGGTGTCAAQLRAGRLAPAAGQDDRGARDGGQQAWQPTRERQPERPTADQPTAERPATERPTAERPTAERPTADGHAPLSQPGPRLVANRGLAWLIGALRLFGGSRMHRISLITRIHHVIRADLMPLRCMIPMGCRRRCVNGAPLRCNGARTPGRARLAYPQEATLCDSVPARGARGRRPRFPGWIRACGWIGCTMVPKSHPEAPIHPGPIAVTNHPAHSGITGRRYNTRKRRGVSGRAAGVSGRSRGGYQGGAAGSALEHRAAPRRKHALRAARTLSAMRMRRRRKPLPLLRS